MQVIIIPFKLRTTLHACEHGKSTYGVYFGMREKPKHSPHTYAFFFGQNQQPIDNALYVHNMLWIKNPSDRELLLHVYNVGEEEEGAFSERRGILHLFDQ